MNYEWVCKDKCPKKKSQQVSREVTSNPISKLFAFYKKIASCSNFKPFAIVTLRLVVNQSIAVVIKYCN